jgi:glycopeptide antibiotics resistance protein
MASSPITGIGISLLLLFCIPKILNFYDVTLDTYGPYLGFIIFIIISSFILPKEVNSDLNPKP